MFSSQIDTEMLQIRAIKPSEIPLLEDFLYEAIYIPKGVAAPSRKIIDSPQLQVYIKDFGKQPHDHCLVAEFNDNIIGAVWGRIMQDYGHIDDETPSLAISLFPEYRGLGIGTQLMKKMLELLKDLGYAQASLSVQKENLAVKLYLTIGFHIIDETTEEYIMIYRF